MCSFIGLTLANQPNKATPNVRSSTKGFYVLNKVEVDECYTTVCRMTRSKVKVMEVLKLQKWPISKSVSSANAHVIKRLTVNYDTSRQYLNSNFTDF